VEWRRHLPLQVRESRIIAIERDPLATPFDGERCEPGIGNSGSLRFRLDAKSLEDIPVPVSWLCDLAMGLSEQIFAKFERLFDHAGRAVDARIGGDPNDGTQCQWHAHFSHRGRAAVDGGWRKEGRISQSGHRSSPRPRATHDRINPCERHVSFLPPAGGPMPGIDLTKLSALQEIEDLDYVERFK
jgi:hypothetical protein